MNIRPSKLKAGDKVICDRRVMTFVSRQASPYCSTRCVFRCDDYVGMNGAKDKGECWMSDNYVVRHCRRLS